MYKPILTPAMPDQEKAMALALQAWLELQHEKDTALRCYFDSAPSVWRAREDDPGFGKMSTDGVLEAGFESSEGEVITLPVIRLKRERARADAQALRERVRKERGKRR